MKANELMIGDWVKLRSWDIAEKIKAIYANGVICNFQKDFDEIEPIPLTPEILEKNGFEYNEHPFVQGWEQFGLTLYHGGDGYRVNCGQNVALQLDSVHQLQHALRLCGIEKEIVL